MAAECLPAVRSTDQSLARLQALMLDAVGPLTDLLEKMGSDNGEEEQILDFQVVEDTVQSALAFPGNAATQFSVYRRTNILEEYNKELVSFAEEMEPELRAAAPLLFGQSFTKQVADHLGQVEALRKVKGKDKKVLSRPPAKTVSLAGEEQALLPEPTNQGILRSNSQEAAAHGEMTINCRAKGSITCNVFNTKCVNCEPYNCMLWVFLRYKVLWTINR